VPVALRRGEISELAHAESTRVGAEQANNDGSTISGLGFDPMTNTHTNRALLLIGASRGLGFALAEEYLNRGWHVVATVRGASETKLHGLEKRASGRLEIETVDINFPDQLASLHTRLASRKFEMLFVNAGVTNDDRELISDVSTDEFVRVMVTNSLSPMRAVEALKDLVVSSGTIGVMSSGQGSVANNENGAHEVYRASKAALNTLMRSFAARHKGGQTLLLLAPGWVKTDLGGPNARLSIGDSIPKLANVIDAQHGKSGLQYLDYLGQKVPW
jgi:NAD(P)-dependent dehydrogenase (short-subunit alcohol dehydrogenase family)